MGKTMNRPTRIEPFKVRSGRGGVSKLVRKILDQWQGEPIIEAIQPIVAYRASFLLDRERVRVVRWDDEGRPIETRQLATLREAGFQLEDVIQGINLRIVSLGEPRTIEQGIILARRARPILHDGRPEPIEDCPLEETANYGDLLGAIIDRTPAHIVPSVIEYAWSALAGYSHPTVSVGGSRRQREQFIQEIERHLRRIVPAIVEAA